MQLISKRVALAAAATGAAAIAMVSLAPASSAATNYTVSPGGSVTAANSGSLTFVDTTSSSKPKLVCTTFKGGGSATKGGHAYVPATYNGSTSLDAAGSLTSHTLSGCTNSVVGAVTVTATGAWKLGISAKSSTGGKGYLFGVGATVSAASGSCKFTVTNGAVYGTYTNSTGVFAGTTTAGLTLSGVTGSACSLVGIKNGDKAYLSGNVKLSPIQKIS